MIKYKNNHEHVAKDGQIQKLIPDEITECALYLEKKYGEPCSDSDTVNAIGAAIGVKGDPARIIAEAKTKLACEDEKCVLRKLEHKIGSELVRAQIDTRFKLRGPNGIELLSNFDIDGTLKQWCARFKDFYPYNFNMLNYMDYSIRDGYVTPAADTLATVKFQDLYAQGYRCGACVINSDRYQGRGKHWMALFFDARSPKWSVEFFNSGGNAPAAEWVNWLLKTQEQMQDVAKSIRARNATEITVDVVKSSSIRHQHSRTECGLYSLFYIYARLCGTPYGYFRTTPVPDQLMFELRQHLFIDKDNGHSGLVTQGGKPVFNFDEFKKKIKVQWEYD